jgi:hypothetical protein
MDFEKVAADALVILVLAAQTWYQRRTQRADKEEVKQEAKAVAKTTASTALVVAEKLETVHKAVNGEGIGGKLDQLIADVRDTKAWQDAHDAQDNRRYDETIARIARLDARPG